MAERRTEPGGHGQQGDGLGGGFGPEAVAFVTTEHFTLQGARAATIAESTGRATMFLSSVSAGLVALGLMATATRLGRPFYAFGLVILPTLAAVGLATFERALQSGIEDYGYARRIAQLRAYYFDQAPGLTAYLHSVPPAERLVIQDLRAGRWQGFRTVAGMVAVITSVLTGSSAGLLASLLADQSLTAALLSGGVFGGASLLVMMRYQQSAWDRVGRAPSVTATEGPGQTT